MQIGHVSDAEEAFSKGLALSQPEAPQVHLMRVLAQMRQGLGDHWQAIQVLTRALEVEPNQEQIQCYFLRGRHTCLAATLPSLAAATFLWFAHKQHVSELHVT